VSQTGIVVQKYGGSSVADVDKIRLVAKRIARTKASGKKVVVVVSAMGKTTNALIDKAKRVSPSPSRRELDMLLTCGEREAMALVAMAVAEGMPVVVAQPAAVHETLGVNSKSQLAELERIYQRQVAQTLLDAGVGLADPSRIDVRGKLSVGRDCFIDVNCVFEGEVVLGDRVRIGANCVLRDARIDSGTVILPMCHIDQAQVGAGSRIGPFARLRPGTVLAEDNHVGNFVEMKNTKMAAHSKANHLAYVGDAVVGARVNIGAGTITCNYDGVNKHQTVIEDDAFIGSDTQLVAPVTVGRGATLGAGTTLTRNAPPGELTLSRAKQTTITGWKRPVKLKPSSKD
jgi:bifunctional UDP-N-acetylglucosamine pyrophosphorylase/glucosamine-1-phosphate N-acetyltransferase